MRRRRTRKKTFTESELQDFVLFIIEKEGACFAGKIKELLKSKGINPGEESLCKWCPLQEHGIIKKCQDVPELLATLQKWAGDKIYEIL